MILHHWDTDGIASASMLLDAFGEQPNITPKIGNYYLDDEDLEMMKNYSEIIIADMNLANAAALCKFASVKIFDHHIGRPVACAEHYNPYFFGKVYPSCTAVIAEKFSMPWDFRAVLGLVGDMGDNVKQCCYYPAVRKYMEKNHTSLEEIKKCAALLDSSYKTYDRNGVVESVGLVSQGIEAVINAEPLWRNLSLLEKDIERWYSLAESAARDEIVFIEMRSRYHVISEVARKIAWELRKTAVVVNRRADRDEIYVRVPKGDISFLIDRMKRRGYNCGGKKEVVGVVAPPGRGPGLAMEIMELVTAACKEEKNMKTSAAANAACEELGETDT